MAPGLSRDEVSALRSRWTWLCVLGGALVVLGAVALAAPWLATLASVTFYGWLIFFSGVCEVMAAFSARVWSGMLLHVLGGVLGIVVGLSTIAHPDAGAQAATLILGVFLLVSGLSRSAAAAVLRYPTWGWAVAGGLVTALLGIMVWAQYPASASWLIGTFVGVDILSRGWSLVMFSLAARKATPPV